MARRMSVAVAAAVAAALAGPVGAADFSDPTWPCIQRKVEGLSVGLMWPLPVEDVALTPETEDAVESLAGRFALRRLPVEEIAPDLDAFVAAHGRDTALLGRVFIESFDRLAGVRARIMDGIADYSLSQIALSERIEGDRAAISAEMAKAEPDFDLVDDLEERLDWDQRVYEDHRQALTYVCETPVLIERRLYAVAQALLAAVEE